MPSGLVALLDDVSVIARMAAASIDDVGAGVAKAGTKAAGVVIDDAAVTPAYVTEFTPDRELPIVWAIAKGSLRNKLLILLPLGLLLSHFLPAAIIPLLMIGGLYLSFEGAEKVLEMLGGPKHGETLADTIEDIAAFEKERIAGAIRTDFILSAEIMAISLAEVAEAGLLQRGVILAVVAVVITFAVYGAVALIVKMDDIGLHLAKRTSAAARRLGRLLLLAMPKLLSLLTSVGTVAMLWVGGGILLHGLEELGFAGPADLAHGVQHAVEHGAGALGGVLAWLSYAVSSAVFGAIIGAFAAMLVHQFQALRRKTSAVCRSRNRWSCAPKSRVRHKVSQIADMCSWVRTSSSSNTRGSNTSRTSARSGTRISSTLGASIIHISPDVAICSASLCLSPSGSSGMPDVLSNSWVNVRINVSRCSTMNCGSAP
jgi:uncharacterized protein